MSSKPLFSIITCFNDPLTLEANVLASLRQQRNVFFELIAIDNTDRHFPSVSSAYNHGGQRATGDYLIFMHQDVYLTSCDWLENASNYLNLLPSLGAAGVSGMTSTGRNMGFIIDRGRYWGRRLASPFCVQTLDELLVIVPRKVFEKVKFDEEFTFHSYCADYCLAISDLGLKAYTLPLMVEHNSSTTDVLSAASLKLQDDLLVNSWKQ